MASSGPALSLSDISLYLYYAEARFARRHQDGKRMAQPHVVEDFRWSEGGELLEGLRG